VYFAVLVPKKQVAPNRLSKSISWSCDSQQWHHRRHGCDYLSQRGPNTGARGACGPRTLSACRRFHKIINTFY